MQLWLESYTTVDLAWNGLSSLRQFLSFVELANSFSNQGPGGTSGTCHFWASFHYWRAFWALGEGEEMRICGTNNKRNASSSCGGTSSDLLGIWHFSLPHRTEFPVSWESRNRFEEWWFQITRLFSDLLAQSLRAKASRFEFRVLVGNDLYHPTQSRATPPSVAVNTFGLNASIQLEILPLWT